MWKTPCSLVLFDVSDAIKVNGVCKSQPADEPRYGILRVFSSINYETELHVFVFGNVADYIRRYIFILIGNPS